MLIHTQKKSVFNHTPSRQVFILCLIIYSFLPNPINSSAQQGDLVQQQGAAETVQEQEAAVPEQVGVQQVARDDEIARRLESILQSTERYRNPSVRVDNGVVFLSGIARREEHKTWAGNLAQRTEDVVAVVNGIDVEPPSIWDFSDSFSELRGLWRQALHSFPLIAVSILILLFTFLLTKATAVASRHFLSRRIDNKLLLNVLVKVIAFPVIILGIYIMLRTSGLTRLALTVVGGTGIIGLVIGIAFQDIAENFLASLLISVHHPFKTGDLIKVKDFMGYVQRVTTRGTLLMAVDGNYIQIPNSIIYKNVIRNYTANPKMRLDFIVGIGYENKISDAQEVGLQVLQDHPAVLQDPAPMILVESLGAATINLSVFFWIDSHQHSFLRAKSSVIRLLVRAYLQNGISLPDEAREVVFPQGIPVRMIGDEQEFIQEQKKEVSKSLHEKEEPSTTAEGNMQSERGEVESQVLQSQMPEPGIDLLSQQNKPSAHK